MAQESKNSSHILKPQSALISSVGCASLSSLEKLLAYDADDRITAREALAHPYFRDLRDKDKRSQKYPLLAGPGTMRYPK